MTLIIRDAAICGGKPVLKGTRITIQQILAELKTQSIEEFCEDFDLDESLVRQLLRELNDGQV
jgi:uncharacterized protein (DUF433 family)